jgi:hypothetical protein
MAVAFLALVLALGGTSYAVTRLPANSVGSKQLKAGAVARPDIKNDAVNGAKVAKDALGGEDINEASLGQVPSALAAGSAGSAGHANSTGVLDKIAYRTATTTVEAAPGEPSMGTASAACDGGQLVSGGGVKVEDASIMAVIDSYPDAGGHAWTARVDNGDTTSAHTFTAYAICIPALAAG